MQTARPDSPARPRGSRIPLARPLLAAAVLTCSAAAHAEIRARVAIASGYHHRGIEHSQSSPAYQASLEYRHQRMGWFAGIWASTVDFGPYDGRESEIDGYLGYGRRLNPDLAMEATVIRYTFQGSSPRDDDWTELQLSAYLASRWTVTWGVADHWWAAEDPSQFTEATYRHPLPARLVLDVTAGYQFAQQAAGVDYLYVEAGVARRWRDLVLRLGYTAADSSARQRFRQFADNAWTASLTWQMR